MAESVYLETSVISALFDERQDPVSLAQHLQTMKWHEEEARHFDLFTSAIALEELREGKFDHQPQAISFASGLQLLPVDEEVLGVSRIYADRLLMPKGDLGDALHLALASVHEVDYLLTWNCRHLANPNKVRRIVDVNRRLGLVTPTMVTPAMLYKEDVP
jgi:hypothetical protein